MSTSCINEVCSHMSYKCNTLNQLSYLHSSRTLSDLQMAPNHEKSLGNGAVKMEHDDKQYTSDIKSSPQRFSDGKDEKKILNILNDPQDAPQSFLKSGPKLSDLMVNGLRKPSGSTVNGNNRLLFDELYRCFKCDFIGRNDDELHAHALKHDPYECSLCGFLANTRDNLKIHLKDDHPETAPDSWDDIIVFHEPPSPTPRRKKKPKTREMFIQSYEKPRPTQCKLCTIFIGKNKMEYFQHLNDAHSDSGRLIRCNMCPFIAVYKHHMEYHIRNHYGSKPFTCDRCDYECVNRSMLNSHYKSHSNVYQYACKNCSYLTKYLHSLKMHLRKYNHEPGRILNADGSINTTTIIDVHGKRRGPKGKKRKSESDLRQESNESPKSKSSPSPPSSFNQIPSQNIRILYNPHIYNNYTGNLYMNKEPSDYRLHSSPNSGGYSYKCAHCDFISESYSVYTYHLFSHPHTARNGGFDHYYPFYLPAQNMDYQFGNPYGANLFPKNNANQSNVVGKRNIGGNQEMNASNNGFHYHNSPNPMDCGSLGSNDMHKEDSSNDGIVIPPNGYQYPRLLGGKPMNNGIKSTLLSPKASSPGTDELPETMNGLWTTLENSSADMAPLDLSFKQPVSPEMKRNGDISPYAQSLDLPLNLISSVGSTSGSESKTTPTLKANRRKGKAFKLNQYVIENDPASDAIETESGLVKSSKPGVGCVIKKSVPRINFKQSLNTPICNGRRSYQEFQPKMETPIPNKVQFDSVGTVGDVPSMKKRRISDVSNDSWCSICCMDQGSAYLLQIHSSYHSDNEPFTCAKCELRCQVKDVFIHHLIAGSRINGKCINAIEYES